jgi:tRNA threonylcarbamoyladenosine biosynthesis protein TsaB
VKLLAIDTSTEACSAALSVNGELSSRYELAPRRHAELILPMIDDLLAGAELSLTQLDGLGFGRGPGAFTGVRIATGVIQGLALSADLPVVPISSLAALAQGAKDKANTLFTAIDARMNEIYYATYRVNSTGIVELSNEENIAQPENAIIPDDSVCFGVGSGWTTYHEILSRQFGKQLIAYEGDRYPSAVDTIILAEKAFEQNQGVPAEQALPVYLRNKVTK